jgi:hypothetical protein
LVSIGLVLSEEKIFEKVYDVRRRLTPSDGNSSQPFRSGELKKGLGVTRTRAGAAPCKNRLARTLNSGSLQPVSLWTGSFPLCVQLSLLLQKNIIFLFFILVNFLTH